MAAPVTRYIQESYLYAGMHDLGMSVNFWSGPGVLLAGSTTTLQSLDHWRQ